MTVQDPSRAGFGERAVALAVDLVVVGLFIAAVGVWLTERTGGSLRLGSPIADSVTCVAAEGLAPGVRLPDDFKRSSLRRCTRSILGIEHDWTLIATQKASGETLTAERRQVVVPLDSAGRIAHPFYLDGLTPLVLVVYLFFLEWRFGASVGKRALGMRVRSLDGAPIGFSQAGGRSLMRLIPLLPLLAGAIWLGVGGAAVEVTGIEPPLGVSYKFDLWPAPDNLDLWGIETVVIIGFLLNYVVTTARRTLPWHDRWAGTHVVRVVSLNPAERPRKGGTRFPDRSDVLQAAGGAEHRKFANRLTSAAALPKSTTDGHRCPDQLARGSRVPDPQAARPGSTMLPEVARMTVTGSTAMEGA